MTSTEPEAPFTTAVARDFVANSYSEYVARKPQSPQVERALQVGKNRSCSVLFEAAAIVAAGPCEVAVKHTCYRPNLISNPLPFGFREVWI
jgi:hypothetical protein